jgi:glycosyltransferase involved in cell wall biosynthesis
MKIAIISTVLGSPWAGSEELWYQTALKCLRDGDQVLASVFEVNGPCKQHDHFIQEGGIIEYRSRYKNGRIHIIKHKFISAFKKVFSWNPDVLILSLGSMTDLTMFPDLERHLKKNTDIRLITICLYNSDTIILNDRTRECLRMFCKRTDHFVFVSHHNHVLTERQLALKLENVSVFSSPVSYQDSYYMLPWPEHNRTFQMASVARFDVGAKGQDIMLEALSSAKWKNRNWNLTIYGKGQDEQYIRDLVDFFDLQDKVKFGGFVNDTRDIWKDNHILVMASRSEGLSLAFLEAMICGRVCVVTDVGGHGEVLVDSVSGFLAEAPIPKYVDLALERAWQQQEQFINIGIKAHEVANVVFKGNPIDQMIHIIRNKN